MGELIRFFNKFVETRFPGTRGKFAFVCLHGALVFLGVWEFEHTAMAQAIIRRPPASEYVLYMGGFTLLAILLVATNHYPQKESPDENNSDRKSP